MNHEQIWQKILKKLEVTSKEIGAEFPHASREGTYDKQNIFWWTNGFWSGLLWLVYRETKNEAYRKIAEECELKLDKALEEYSSLHHDVGFMWILTSIANYKITGNEVSKRRALHAANILAGRFNIKGNFIRAWNKDHHGWAIIDCMMNIPLLYWAAEESQDSRYRHIAIAHSNTVLDHFIRPDGSVNHIVCFDKDTGEFVDVKRGQGYSTTSAWSRGASWAIYGMALSFKYTGEVRYLDAAKKAAHFFIANLPENGVPSCDFRAPIEAPMTTDTSAGACAASGMLEIAKYVSDCEKGLYIHHAKNMLNGLYENHSNFDTNHQEFIGAGRVSYHSAEENINIGLIYGDYFFAEAIAKLNNPEMELFW